MHTKYFVFLNIDRTAQNVRDLRTPARSALLWMGTREGAPKRQETADLPGGSNTGNFWHDCKMLKRCGRPPYDRLLANPILRADYRTTARHERTMVRPKAVNPEIKVRAVQA